MKKKTILATILCAILMTGCAGGAGTNTPADVNVDVDVSADVNVRDTDTGADKTAEVVSDTADDEVADAVVDTGADETKDDGLEGQMLTPGNLSDLVGVWYEADVLDARTLTVYEDGTFSLEYRGGGALYGTVSIIEEEMSDGNSVYWYAFYDQEGEIWEAAAIPDEGITDDIYFGQGGEPHFISEASLYTPSFVSDVEAEAFVGTWQAGRCAMTITEEPEGYVVEVKWGNTAAETTVWTYFCKFDDILKTLDCEGTAVCQLYNSENETTEYTEIYSDGSGSFVINEDGFLVWFDAVDNTGEGLLFEKCD